MLQLNRVVASLVLIGSLGPSAGSAVSAPSIFQATADTYVNQSRPAKNFGGANAIKLDYASPTMRSYIKFDLSSLPSDHVISSATLRLYSFPPNGDACPAQGIGVDVYRAASDGWTELGITYANAPGSTGERLSSADGFGVKQYVEFDVTSAVATNGIVSFVLQVPSCGAGPTNVTDFKSKEAAGNRPQLVVLSDAPPPTPTQCSDGTDNDADGLTDFSDDPGCMSLQDHDETDPLPFETVIATGDIACDPGDRYFDGSNSTRCQHRRTVDLVGTADAVLTLGDLQYSDGTKAKFDASYDPSWGSVAGITFPVPGNHEYGALETAAGYFDYWEQKSRPAGDRGSGYYSWDLSSSWHMIALNTSDGPCVVGPSCAEGSAQNDWLDQDLAAVPTSSCILAYWHHPLFNSGLNHGNEDVSAVAALWTDLYSAGADLILNGHEHNYQRYAPMSPEGVLSSDGIRQFISGAGGKSLYGLNSVKDPGYQFGSKSFGVLELQLGPGSYSWRFINLSGTVVDSGGPVSCHG